jgi:hypothetical protein
VLPERAWALIEARGHEIAGNWAASPRRKGVQEAAPDVIVYAPHRQKEDLAWRNAAITLPSADSMAVFIQALSGSAASPRSYSKSCNWAWSPLAPHSPVPRRFRLHGSMDCRQMDALSNLRGGCINVLE